MAQITFAAMPQAVITEAADMPHILGDPADALWKGVAERSNDNFAAVQAYATSLDKAVHISAELSGAAAFVVDPNWTLTGGYAYAQTLTFGAGINYVHLNMMIVYNSTTAISTGPFGILTPATTIKMGTLPAALRSPQAHRLSCHWSDALGASQIVGSIYMFESTGVLQLNKASAPNMKLTKGGFLSFDANYLTVP